MSDRNWLPCRGKVIPKSFRFDFGVFDEAHKTAGRNRTTFSFALTDDHLPIRKRLFLTATPRHYDVHKRDKDGDAKLVYSMDSEESYGPRGYTLTFAEAAKRQVICDYRVVISVVTDEMLDEEQRRAGEVVVRGDVVRAQQVANQIALREAVVRYDVRKIFSFHRNVASAKSFVAEGGEGIQTELADFQALHVNGAMLTAARDELIHEFRKADRAIITNARCLTEGVDVPAVDMVAFMSPKRSKVDIVQATGRAMRRSRGKTCGYVMLPLYLEQARGESVEEALSRTNFVEIWNVLSAMQDQDEELAETIRKMREDRGRGKGFDDSALRERVTVLGPEISLHQLRSGITLRLLERLSPSWDEFYGQLDTFKEAHGHCNVPQRYSANPGLGSWVSNQRSLYSKNQLSAIRIARLNDLGFVWDVRLASWEEMFSALQRFRELEGHCNVPNKYPDNPRLGHWVSDQRKKRSLGTLTDDQCSRLEHIGFSWNLKQAYWESMYVEAVKYFNVHGHLDVPQRYPENPTFGAWVNTQRKLYRKGLLDSVRKNRLSQIGFVWEPLDAAWDTMFSALHTYQKKHGHTDVPQKDAEHRALGIWVSEQRKAHHRNRLGEERTERLCSIGFSFDPKSDLWEEMYQALLNFQKIHGHCRVPFEYDDNPGLSRWVRSQRERFVDGSLSDDRVEKLSKLDFTWNTKDAAWEETFEALVEFAKINGHCNASAQSATPRLVQWVGQQRTRYRLKKLPPERVRKLESIGFVWSVKEAAWEERFSELEKFHKRYGHVRVSRSARPALNRWLLTQKSAVSRGALDASRLERLAKLGVEWAIHS